jgi:hypothetical protein
MRSDVAVQSMILFTILGGRVEKGVCHHASGGEVGIGAWLVGSDDMLSEVIYAVAVVSVVVEELGWWCHLG